MKQLGSRNLSAAIIAVTGSACIAQQGELFTEISTSGLPNVSMWGSDSTGGTAVGWGAPTGGSERALRWRRSAGLAALQPFAGVSSSQAMRISDDGVIVGSAFVPGTGNRLFRTAPGGLAMIDTGPMSSLAGISRDGTVIAWTRGSGPGAADRAWRWTGATGAVELAGFPEGCVTALGVSGDGHVIVGGVRSSCPDNLTYRPFRLIDGVYHELPMVPGAVAAVATLVNYDGTVIVGISSFDPFTNGVFIWRLEDNAQIVQVVAAPAGFRTVQPIAMSDDGSVVAGSYSIVNGPDSLAYLWTQTGGYRDLTQLIASMGVPLGLRTLAWAAGMSGDGAVIAGVVTTPGPRRGFVIDLRNDTDGDGLLDHWEINGIPYISDQGRAKRIHLPDADPAHKDLYVEVDSMAGMTLQQSAVDLVVAAFAAAPLSNPDGVAGVLLHVLRDEPDLPHLASWQTDGCWPTSYTSYYTAHVGTDAERQAGGGLLFRSAKAKAYRYCIVADNAQPEIGGCAGLYDDRSVIFIGSMPEASSQAAVFMHEFGHMLGLDHGGGDAVNGKPNYPSIMNYVLSYPFSWSSAFWRLDYSRAGASVLGHLQESSLDETAGIGSAGGPYSDFIMPFGFSVPGGGRDLGYVSLDGAPVDYGDTTGTMMRDGEFTTGVVQDLNYLPSPPPGINLPANSSPGQSLHAFDDWAAVILRTPEAAGPGAPAPAYPTNELTLAARQWIEQNFPIPGGAPPCYANCDHSTAAPLLNVLDFACFLNKFAAGDSYANCDGSTAAPVLNVLDFACFLNRFAAGCP